MASISPDIDTNFIPDLPMGPLNEYRKKAKFNWKRLMLILDEEASVKIKYRVWKLLENDPLFSKAKYTLSTDELKRLAAMQVNKLTELDIIPKDVINYSYRDRTKFLMSTDEALYSYSSDLSVKIALGVSLFVNSLSAMGTERHKKYYNAAWNREIVACFAITEVAHGSNTKNIRTTATYDPITQEFIINTPDFEAAKCWIGNLGKTATICLTFANLYTADGINHGLHGFVVPIRNPKTLMAYPGVIVGDMGEKIGLNGVDNGFMMFSNYRIPRENLLNRIADVTPEGSYETVLMEPSRALGAALETLSVARLGIIQESVNNLSSATVIAVRYAALRKQFGHERNGPEVPIIEYQLHQWRIFPYLAAACVLRVFAVQISGTYLKTVEDCQSESNAFEVFSQLVGEFHAIISSSKPLLTWTARDAIQESREACGGHGYLKISNLGELRNNHDASVTYEGDNNVLQQQASNWLIKQWDDKIESPLGTANFLKNRTDILRRKFEDIIKVTPVESMEFPIECFEWLICYLLDKTASKIRNFVSNGAHRFDAKNNSQVYTARDICRAYPQYVALCSFRTRFHKPDVTPELKEVLQLIYLIYSYWIIDQHMTSFCQGAFAKNPTKFVDLIRSKLLEKCGEFKNSAVSVADSIAPPDFALNSAIAKSDGLLYQNLQHELMTNPNAFSRPSWWRDILLPDPPSLKSKL
ncbi:peroxisomal acyl-coenzyme A oxidase 3 [Condylostylus longicornis]|uniref:peroxisomal acyl-coenzyme A oxidase 3 n=1 Tax=Condylostylus longicornis TaxID=2530218 RepID=UPI00244DA10A|nr:peroxisomal acyl-coenzyme A oxidase 3 [Condylostylus longicornis]